MVRLAGEHRLLVPEADDVQTAAEIRAAKAFCARCAVRICCLAYAVDTGQTAGIWGGYDENERRLMRQGLRRPALTRGPA